MISRSGMHGDQVRHDQLAQRRIVRVSLPQLKASEVWLEDAYWPAAIPMAAVKPR
jgi:hypothetical protein